MPLTSPDTAPPRRQIGPGRMLALNTLAFATCFALWLLYGALVKFLGGHGLYSFSQAQVGALIAAPVLTGSLLRLPVGILTDRFGGRPVFTGVLLVTALGMFAVSMANGFWGFLLAGLVFGVAGSSFAVGVASTSAWFPRDQQGTALGIFGCGNAGAALTLLVAPRLLQSMTETNGGAPAEDAWRCLPLAYAAVAVAMAALYWLATENRLVGVAQRQGLGARLAPLGQRRVWRFGLYYFCLFGGFVGLSGWLVKYYVDVYQTSLASAGALAAAFSLPSSVVRGIGGWLSDRRGARSVLYWVLSSCLVGCLVLCLPLGLGSFTVVIGLLGVAMGVGMAAVYKHIPFYFPEQVGTVGGVVGLLGGLGGFCFPLAFGYLLALTSGLAHPDGWWLSAWYLLAASCAAALGWMHWAVRGIELGKKAPAPAIA